MKKTLREVTRVSLNGNYEFVVLSKEGYPTKDKPTSAEVTQWYKDTMKKNEQPVS